MPKEFTAIGLKFSEQYSPEVLSALGKAFIKECMQNSINASHQPQRGVKLFAQDVNKLNKEISSISIDENNSILKILNYIQRIIEEKITHFEEFAEVYIDFNILFSHVTSENIIYDIYFTNMLPLVKHINILTKSEDVADFFENILNLIESLKLKTPDKEFYQHEISILKSYSNIRDIKSYKVTFQKTEEATTIILANFCEAIKIFFDQYDDIQMSEESTEKKSSSHFNNRYRVFPGSSNDNLPTVKKSKKSSSNDKDEESDEEIKPDSGSPPYYFP